MDKTLFPTDAEFITFPEETEGEHSHYGRSKWPQGPWHAEEYDKVVWIDPTTGLDCMLVRSYMGNWCGYVGVPEQHPWHGITYSGCTNRHPPLTQEERITEAQKWVAEATTGSSRDLAERSLDAVQSGGWMSKMETWRCTGYSEGSCPTPESAIDVHGGLTFSDHCHKGGRICHTPRDGRSGNVWWFGYDTAHGHDLVPGMLASSAMMREKLKDDPIANDLFREHLDYDPETGTNTEYGMHQSYKDYSYCKQEVESMALQLRDTHKAATGEPV